MGAGGLECDRATSQRRGKGGIEIFLKKIKIFLNLNLNFFS
jgi:hypothetical protein